jgi:hypothetical protein
MNRFTKFQQNRNFGAYACVVTLVRRLQPVMRVRLPLITDYPLTKIVNLLEKSSTNLRTANSQPPTADRQLPTQPNREP